MKRALFSVSDKAGVVEFATQLESLGWEIIATGGTMKLLQEAGLEIINISEVTGFPEIWEGATWRAIASSSRKTASNT